MSVGLKLQIFGVATFGVALAIAILYSAYSAWKETR
jgi:hypothetical protein